MPLCFEGRAASTLCDAYGLIRRGRAASTLCDAYGLIRRGSAAHSALVLAEEGQFPIKLLACVAERHGTAGRLPPRCFAPTASPFISCTITPSRDTETLYASAGMSAAERMRVRCLEDSFSKSVFIDRAVRCSMPAQVGGCFEIPV